MQHANPGLPPPGRAQQQQQQQHQTPPMWTQALELDKRLRNELRRRSFWDADVRRIRHSLAQTYEALLFSHLEFSTVHDVEQCLWKSVYYRPIEEFRSRLKSLSSNKHSSSASAAAAVPPPVTAEEAKQQMQKLTAAYLKFLDEAVAFYKRMLWKLQWVFGSVGATVEVDASVQNEIEQSSSPSAKPADCMALVHRCLIYLGDLCRYQSQVMRNSKPEWTRAVAFYKQAASVLPSSGHPFNQLAVMAYYGADELRAVYYYFRSLAVSAPFITARENLYLLFERNRTRYAAIAASHATAAVTDSSAAQRASALSADVATRFVRLHGMLFDRINAYEFDTVHTRALADLDTYLASAPALREAAAAGAASSDTDTTLLQLAVLSAFSAHAAAQPSVASATALSRAALCAALRYAQRVFSAASRMRSETDPGFTPLMTAAHVMLNWMLSHPAVLHVAPASVPAATGAAQSEIGLAEELFARADCWKAATRLAVKLRQLAHIRGLDLDSMPRLQVPEDVELRGFLPLQAVVDVAVTWPKADRPDGPVATGAAGARLTRMLEGFRSIAVQLEFLPRSAHPYHTTNGATSAAGGAAVPGVLSLVDCGKAAAALDASVAEFKGRVEDLFLEIVVGAVCEGQESGLGPAGHLPAAGLDVTLPATSTARHHYNHADAAVPQSQLAMHAAVEAATDRGQLRPIPRIAGTNNAPAAPAAFGVPAVGIQTASAGQQPPALAFQQQQQPQQQMHPAVTQDIGSLQQQQQQQRQLTAQRQQQQPPPPQQEHLAAPSLQLQQPQQQQQQLGFLGAQAGLRTVGSAGTVLPEHIFSPPATALPQPSTATLLSLTHGHGHSHAQQSPTTHAAPTAPLAAPALVWPNSAIDRGHNAAIMDPNPSMSEVMLLMQQLITEDQAARAQALPVQPWLAATQPHFPSPWFRDPSGSGLHFQQHNGVILQPAAQGEEEGEDEEVIVYQPAARSSSSAATTSTGYVLGPSHAAAAALPAAVATGQSSSHGATSAGAMPLGASAPLGLTSAPAPPPLRNESSASLFAASQEASMSTRYTFGQQRDPSSNDLQPRSSVNSGVTANGNSSQAQLHNSNSGNQQQQLAHGNSGGNHQPPAYSLFRSTSNQSIENGGVGGDFLGSLHPRRTSLTGPTGNSAAAAGPGFGARQDWGIAGLESGGSRVALGSVPGTHGALGFGVPDGSNNRAAGALAGSVASTASYSRGTSSNGGGTGGRVSPVAPLAPSQPLAATGQVRLLPQQQQQQLPAQQLFQPRVLHIGGGGGGVPGAAMATPPLVPAAAATGGSATETAASAAAAAAFFRAPNNLGPAFMSGDSSTLGYTLRDLNHQPPMAVNNPSLYASHMQPQVPRPPLFPTAQPSSSAYLPSAVPGAVTGGNVSGDGSRPAQQQYNPFVLPRVGVSIHAAATVAQQQVLEMQAERLVNSNLEATAVAMADNVLSALDEDDDGLPGGRRGTSGGGGGSSYKHGVRPSLVGQRAGSGHGSADGRTGSASGLSQQLVQQQLLQQQQSWATHSTDGAAPAASAASPRNSNLGVRGGSSSNSGLPSAGADVFDSNNTGFTRRQDSSLHSNGSAGQQRLPFASMAVPGAAGPLYGGYDPRPGSSPKQLPFMQSMQLNLLANGERLVSEPQLPLQPPGAVLYEQYEVYEQQRHAQQAPNPYIQTQKQQAQQQQQVQQRQQAQRVEQEEEVSQPQQESQQLSPLLDAPFTPAPRPILNRQSSSTLATPFPNPSGHPGGYSEQVTPITPTDADYSFLALFESQLRQGSGAFASNVGGRQARAGHSGS